MRPAPPPTRFGILLLCASGASLDYRFEPARTPDLVARHFLLLSAGVHFAN